MGSRGQEKDDEVAGYGNSYTAMFWQYDSRLGRRWNQDPKPNPSISNYATFANNPIYYLDMLGDTVHRFNNEGIYLGMAELDIDGVRGSVGSYSTITDADGNEIQMWNSDRDFRFNDPENARDQMGFVQKDDKYLQFISDGNMNDMMKRSGVEEMWLHKRLRKAQTESSGGDLDFAVRYLGGEPAKENNDMYGGFYLFENGSTAYNVQGAGNFLWGQSMYRMGFAYSSAQFHSERNEWFNDDPADQKAIRTGFFHRVTTARTIHFINGKVDHSQ